MKDSRPASARPRSSRTARRTGFLRSETRRRVSRLERLRAPTRVTGGLLACLAAAPGLLAEMWTGAPSRWEAAAQVVSRESEERPPGGAVRRVVSLVPSVSEILRAMGAGGRLVGVSRHGMGGGSEGPTVQDTSDGLDGASGALPVVGDAVTPSVEAIVALEPDLVVSWAGITRSGVEMKLRAVGVEVHRARVESLDDLFATTRILGSRLGLETQADSLVRSLRRGLQAARVSPSAGAAAPTVLVVLHPAPPLVAGPGSFLDQLLHRLGAANVFADAPGAWPRPSLETLVHREPDVVVVPASTDGGGAPAWLAAPPWSGMEAVRSGRVLALPADLLARPGPGVVELARRLADVLYDPESSGTGWRAGAARE